MNRSLFRIAALTLSASIGALAGPPLICERIEIGNAKSLPWNAGNNWDGSKADYKVSRLTADTMALLTPGAPLNLRMETMRRAAIYAARHEGAAADITSQLLARMANAEASGKPDPLAWFDAGYFTETLRQVTFIYRYNMLSAEEKTRWKLRGETLGLDGRAWIEKAIRLGGRGMEVVIPKIEDYRQADLKLAQR